MECGRRSDEQVETNAGRPLLGKERIDYLHILNIPSVSENKTPKNIVIWTISVFVESVTR